METKVRISERFSLSLKDFFRGLVIASITSALVVVQTSIDSGSVVFNWKQIGIAAIGGGVAYLLKNFLLEPPKVITTTESNAKAKEVTKDIKEII